MQDSELDHTQKRQIQPMPLSKYIKRIEDIARTARSESKLEGEFNQILKECLAEFGIDFNPHVNETLKSMGLSQVDADRPDGVFGHIVYDYKAPKVLSSVKDLQGAKQQIEGYLDRITGGHKKDTVACGQWFGYVCDGTILAYCRSNSRVWQWSHPLPITESTLLFLVHAFRSLQRKPLTAKLLSSAFGKESGVAQELIRVMCSHLSKPRHRTNMLFREWKRLFEQVSMYGLDQLPSLKQWAADNGIATKDASHILFAMHSYYSLVVKIVTSELLSISTHNTFSVCEEIMAAVTIEDLYSVMTRIENGDYYRRYRISNFLEGDFFSWYMNERSRPLASAIKGIAREFLQFEPASAILLPEAKQDLLKEFYSSLVDEQIRHDLGEYYTPDWLAQHLLNQAGYQGDLHTKVLDPACGSGTFLVEAIIRLKETCFSEGLSALETLETILANIKGLDLNPLAVISARANYILSIYDLAFDLGQDIELPVYLADSINVPVEKQDKDGSRYLEYYLDTEVEDFVLEIPWELVHSQVIGHVLLACEEAILREQPFDGFLRTIRRNKQVAPHLSDKVVERLRHFYTVIESLESYDWDKIWCRIIKNNFNPGGFSPFDLIIGNPPWVRWSRLPKTYRNRVKNFCNYYGLVSGRGYSGGIESDISTVIIFSAADNWLREGGLIAFLITWTVFKSGSARGFRLGSLPGDTGLKVKLIEDMTNLQPFPDATNETAVYIAEKIRPSRNTQFQKTACKIWKPQRGKARFAPSTPLSEVYETCEIEEGVACPIGEWGTPFFTGDIAHFRQSAFLRGNSQYLNASHRGTISDCARVYWVKVLRYSSETNRALIRTLTVEELPRARTIDPVAGAWIEADLLFPLIRGRDLGRYCSNTDGWYQIIPNRHYENVESEEDFADNYPLAYSYFKNYESILNNRSSYKRYQRHLPFYVVYCVGDYSFSTYKVVWMEQQAPGSFRAAVVSEDKHSIVPNKLIVPDHKLYFTSFDTAIEAYYLCGFLNSLPVRTWLGGFLLGKQIGTTIFEHMNVPRFDPDNDVSKRIAVMSEAAHADRDGTKDKTFLQHKMEKKLAEYVRKVCT
ncbi:MAG: N-6 DNA methylase [Candidatus Thiosymbion ectosymbiont of Robbea hypermnestra]|nr:N-6 DNA methylase [Candidatus Thiosymbion ectosymbiont of Robbea hypermnestra]